MTVHSLPTNQDLDPGRLREVFGVFPSGVVAVAAEVDGVHVGLAASSFTSVSLDPPLVSFSVATTSRTWPTLRRAGHLGVTILADHHDEACRQLAGPVEHRFDGAVADRHRGRRADAGRRSGPVRLHDPRRGGGRRPPDRAPAAARRRAHRHLPAAGLPPQRLRLDPAHGLARPTRKVPRCPCTPPCPNRPTPPSPRRVAMASAVGATIEWYDFFLYGTAAGLVFEKLFFSGLSGPAAQFASFATFAVGFLARPIGGFFFGHFGDRVGRKKMLLLTLLIMGAGTAAIGLLPSYDAIGWWAPVLLVTLRVLQGIGVGGEYGGAVLLAVEYAPAERRGFFGSFAHIGVPGGLLLASGAFSLASLLPDEAFLAWGWRACFLASVVLLAIGAYIRLSVMETPAFARVQERKEVSRSRCATCSPPSPSGCCSAWAPASSRASRSTSSRSSCSPTSSPTSACRGRWRCTA